MQIKYTNFVILIVILLSTLTAQAKEILATYSIPLTKVEVLNENMDSCGTIDNFEIITDSNGLLNSEYDSEKFQIIWRCDGKRFWFNLLNKTNRPIVIDWNKITYVSTTSESGTVIHKGIKYSERNQSQLQTIVPRLSKYSDFLVPASSCYLREGSYFSYGGWEESFLFPCIYKKKKLFEENAHNLIGQTMRISMPLEIEGVINYYEFEFTLQDLNPIK